MTEYFVGNDKESDNGCSYGNFNYRAHSVFIGYYGYGGEFCKCRIIEFGSSHWGNHGCEHWDNGNSLDDLVVRVRKIFHQRIIHSFDGTCAPSDFFIKKSE